MPKAAGRLAEVRRGATMIGGVRVSTIAFAAEPIDVTDRDSNGIIELLATAATQQVTLTVEGIYTDVTLRTIAMTPATSKLLTDLTFKFADALTAADTLGGNFFMTEYEEGNPHDDATTFSATFVSSGPWALT